MSQGEHYIDPSALAEVLAYGGKPFMDATVSLNDAQVRPVLEARATEAELSAGKAYVLDCLQKLSTIYPAESISQTHRSQNFVPYKALEGSNELPLPSTAEIMRIRSVESFASSAAAIVTSPLVTQNLLAARTGYTRAAISKIFSKHFLPYGLITEAGQMALSARKGKPTNVYSRTPLLDKYVEAVPEIRAEIRLQTMSQKFGKNRTELLEFLLDLGEGSVAALLLGEQSDSEA